MILRNLYLFLNIEIKKYITLNKILKNVHDFGGGASPLYSCNVINERLLLFCDRVFILYFLSLMKTQSDTPFSSKAINQLANLSR